MNNAWKIRLLGGVLHGREVWLHEGQLSLGERGCDLCIPLDIEGCVRLLVDDGQLFVDAGKAPIRVNGRRYVQSKPLPNKGILHVGGISMVFGPQDADLAAFRLPTRLSFVLWGCVFFLIMLLMLSALWLARITPETTEHNVHERVDNLLRQQAFTQIHAHWDQDLTLHLSGYCQMEKTIQPLLTQLQTWGVLYRNHVVCADQLVRNVEDVLAQAGYTQAHVVSRGEGDVDIHADINMGAHWAAVQSLLADIPGLAHWHIENFYEEQGEAIISALVQSGLGGAVSMTTVGHAYTISGVLNQEDKQRLSRLIADIRQRYPNIDLNYQEVPTSSEFSQRLPSPVAGIVHGRHGDYLLLENGIKLSVGSRLPDGSEVVVLNDKAIAFKYGRTLFNYPFNF